MQVNQSTSPNFGKLKALKSPTLTKALQNEKVETLRTIQEVGEKLKDTKFFDLQLFAPHSSKITFDIISPQDAPFEPFSSIKCKKVCHGANKNVLVLNNVYGIGKSYVNGIAKYNVWNCVNDPVTDINELADIVLELDNAAIAKYNEKVATKKALELYQKEVNELTDEILKDFGE